jgi:predicted dienelactone hydrolase
MRSRWVRGLLAIAVLIGGALVAATFLDTTIRPPTFDPPGYLVTTITSPDREKPVTLHVWYPTDSTAASDVIGQNGLFYGSHMRRDAPPKPGRMPVVVLSHGSGGNAERLGWLAGYLAHRGMIVVAPDHPGTTSGDSDPVQTPLIWQRTDDLTAALDLMQNAPPGGLQPDMTRVGVLGFSLGGYTALGLAGVRVTKAAFIDHCSGAPDAVDCAWMVAAGVDFTAIDAARYDASHADARVTAAVAIDPALVNAVVSEGLTGISVPFLLINLGDVGAIPGGSDAADIAKVLPDATYQTVPGAAHFSFLSECSVLGKIVIGVAGEDNICSDWGLRDRAIIQDELRSSIGGFLAGQFGLP